MIKKMSDNHWKRILEEVRNIRLSEWNCKEEKTPACNVTQLSERMTYFPMKKWLIGLEDSSLHGYTDACKLYYLCVLEEV